MLNAIQVALNKVHTVLGELIDLHPNIVPEEWISEYTGINDIEYINPKTVKARSLEYNTENNQICYHELYPKLVLFIGGYYVLRDCDSSSHWLIGELGEGGVVDCWSRLDSLKEAIDQIKDEIVVA